MTTPITKEQRIEEVETLIDNAEEWASFYEHPIHDKPHRDMFEGMARVMREYLAALKDAEPVADVVAWHKEGEERTCDIRWRRFDVAPGPLFAVAQPVMKDHQIRELVNELRDIAVEYHDTQQLRERIARKVRAAMLNHQSSNKTSSDAVPGDEIKQQASNSFTDAELEMMAHGDNPQANAYRELLAFRRNSPVIPDGWIPVSERVPEVGQAVLAYRPDAPESDDPLIKMAVYTGESHHGFNCYCTPTHWMPLPAAPQQEGK